VHLDAVCAVLAVIRRTKTEAKVSQRAEVEHVSVSATKVQIDAIEKSLEDLRNAGAIANIEFRVHDDAVITANVRLVESA
jgi:valyl-tRNA synthetase